MHEVNEKTHKKPRNMMKIEIINPKQNFDSDQRLNNAEK